MTNVNAEYDMAAGTSEILEASDESRMLIQSVGNITGTEISQSEKYFVVTDQEDLVEITGVDKQDCTNLIGQNDEHWAAVCRICANTSDHLIPIFEGEGLEHELNNKIHRYLPIQVSEADNLPLHLCYHCAATLLAWHELSEGCLDAEQRLLQMQHEHHQSNQSTILSESLTISSGVPAAEDTEVSSKRHESEEELDVKGEFIQESTTNDSERSHGEDCTVSVMQKPKAEIEETSFEERLEHVECGECEATYTEMVDLVNHMNSEHNDLVHYCSYCKMVYRGNVKDFKKHQASHVIHKSVTQSAAKNIVSCLFCKQDFNGVEKLEQHLVEHAKGNVIKTECKNTTNNIVSSLFCKQDFNGIEEIEQHLFEHAKGNVIKSKCSRVKSYTCDTCEENFPTKYSLRKHVRTHEDVVPVENNEEIEILKNAKVIINDRCLFKCGTCEKLIITRRGFLRHIRIHTGNRPCKCTICGNQYRIKQDLTRHIRDVHERIKKYQCEICARPFANKGAKEDHQRIHTGERPYSCKLCKKTFRTLNSIYIHNRIHTNYKPHKCPSCDKHFPNRQRLNNHLTTHTGIKKYSCEICFKFFSVKGEVARHRAIHSQDKPFLCTTCGMKFGQKRYLRNHIKQHHKEQSTLLLAKLTESSH